MWIFARGDLKIRLTMRIVAVAVACFAAMSAGALLDAGRSARARIDQIAGLVAKDLQLQRSKMNWITDPAAAFPDLQNIAAVVMAPGLCIACPLFLLRHKSFRGAAQREPGARNHDSGFACCPRAPE
jgi:hypothetical protein